MSETPVVTPLGEINCPLCGSKGAKIERKSYPWTHQSFFSGGFIADKIVISDPNCGYKDLFEDYFRRVFARKNLPIPDCQTPGIQDPTKLSAHFSCTYYQAKEIWETAQEIISKGWSFPINISLNIEDLSDTICPVCDGKEFFKKGYLFTCKNETVNIGVVDYFFTFLKKQGYKYYENSFDGFFNVEGKNGVAKIRFQWNGFQPVLIVNQWSAVKEEHQQFCDTIVKINEFLPPEEINHFKIIINDFVPVKLT